MAFFKQSVPSAPTSAEFVSTSAVGEGIEAQLDIQYTMGVALGVTTDFCEQINMEF